jgi:biotin carboxylase
MAVLFDLERWLPEGSVVVVEDPNIVRRRRLWEMTDAAPVLGEVVGCAYAHPAAADRFFLEHRDLDPAAIIPISDYAVPFAARLAERYGVVGAGYGASLALRDKGLLRAVTAAAGIPNPESVTVTGPPEVASFMARVGGPAVLKPANRRASIGTKIIQAPADVDTAWAECADQDEGVLELAESPPPHMLVERYVHGPEYSVEMLVRAGRVVFGAPTRKFLYDGSRPIEQGHLHPADVPPELSRALVDSTRRVVEAVGMDTGFVHGEWIVENGVPHLVECAGRMAGDLIIELVMYAWRYDIVHHYLEVMCGRPVSVPPPDEAPSHAAMWTAHAPSGRVTALDGIRDAKQVPGVHTLAPSVKVGDHVTDLRSSWDRAVTVTAEGPTAAEALARARRAAALIKITVDPDD